MMATITGYTPESRYMQATILAVLLTAFSYAVGVMMGWTDSTYIASPMGLLEVFAVTTSYAGTWLCNTQNRFNYVLGVITTAAYSVLFYQQGATALAIFNLYLVFSLAYGWVRWGNDRNPLRVTDLKSKKSMAAYVLFGVSIFVLYYAIAGILGVGFAEISVVDVTLAAMFGVAQLLLDNKRRQTWLVWAVINVISIPYFIHLGYTLVAFQYIFFLINTYIGYKEWTRTMDPT